VQTFVGDVGNVFTQVFTEISTIKNTCKQAAYDFDLESVQDDVATFALNEVIAAVHLDFYLGDEIVRQYRYRILDTPTPASGPPADAPPIGPIVAGVRARIVVTANPLKPKEYVDKFFQRRGWTTAAPLHIPGDAISGVYGVMASGSYAVERRLVVSPRHLSSLTTVRSHIVERRQGQ
jgi:hypothetical protein